MTIDIVPVLGIAVGLLTLGTTLFLIGKWAGATATYKDNITKLESSFEHLHKHIEAMRDEGKKDRHEFRAEMQRWQERLWEELRAEVRIMRDELKTQEARLRELEKGRSSHA